MQKYRYNFSFSSPFLSLEIMLFFKGKQLSSSIYIYIYIVRCQARKGSRQLVGKVEDCILANYVNPSSKTDTWNGELKSASIEPISCHSPIRITAMGYLLAPSTHQTVPLPLPPNHPQHPLEWLRYQYWSLWKGEYRQHRSHDTEVPATLSRTHF